MCHSRTANKRRRQCFILRDAVDVQLHGSRHLQVWTPYPLMTSLFQIAISSISRRRTEIKMTADSCSGGGFICAPTLLPPRSQRQHWRQHSSIFVSELRPGLGVRVCGERESLQPRHGYSSSRISSFFSRNRLTLRSNRANIGTAEISFDLEYTNLD